MAQPHLEHPPEQAPGDAAPAPRVPRHEDSNGSRRIIAAVLAALVLATGVAWFVRLRRDAERLTVDPATLHFGEIWAQDQFRWTLRVHNPSREEVEVRRIETSCACTSVEPQSFVVQPGETVDLQLTVDSIPRRAEDARQGVRDFVVEGVIETGDPARNAQWKLAGRVRNAVAVAPPLLHCGEVGIEGGPLVAQTLEVSAHVPLRGLTAECDPARAAVKVERSAKEGDAFRVSVLPNAGLPPGDFRFAVRLQPVPQDGGPLPDVPVFVDGTVLPDLHTLPDKLDFQMTAPGERVQETVTLQSRRQRRFVVENVSADSPEVGVAQVAELRTPERDAFRVSAAFRKPGQQSAAVAIKVRMESGEVVALTLPVACYIVDPQGEVPGAAPQAAEPAKASPEVGR